MVWIIFGEPKPLSPQSMARMRIRSINGLGKKVSGSTAAKSGCVNPIVLAPSDQRFAHECDNCRSHGRRKNSGEPTKVRDGVVAGRQRLSPGNLQPAVPQGSTVITVTKPRVDNDVEVSRYVAETADRLLHRLAAVSSDVLRTLENPIPELRGDAQLMALLGAR